MEKSRWDRARGSRRKVEEDGEDDDSELKREVVLSK